MPNGKSGALVSYFSRRIPGIRRPSEFSADMDWFDLILAHLDQ